MLHLTEKHSFLSSIISVMSRGTSAAELDVIWLIFLDIIVLISVLLL